MRPIQLIWKDIKILTEFFIEGTKEEILQSLRNASSKETYRTKLRKLSNLINRVFTDLKNLSYFMIFFFIVTLSRGMYYFSLLFALLSIILWLRYVWKTKEPLEYYQNKYFKGE